MPLNFSFLTYFFSSICSNFLLFYTIIQCLKICLYKLVSNSTIISLLNSSINSLSLYLLPLTALLNSYINSFITLLSYSTFFNSATFVNSLSLLPNSFFNSVKKSLTVRNSKFLVFKSFKILSFQIFTDSSYIYIRTYCICSSTNTSLILILIQSLYSIIRKPTV